MAFRILAQASCTSLSSRAGIPQRPFAAALLGDITAPDQLGPVAFRLQALGQVLDIGDEVLLIRLCRDLINTAGGFLVQIVPAFEQQGGIQEPVEVLKTMVFAGLRPLGYSLQGG